MASRHHSLDYSEVKDVTQLVEDFQQMNRVRVRMALEVMPYGKAPGLQLTAEAWESLHPQPEAKPLASVSVSCFGMNLKHFKDAVTHVLYMLDGRLAYNEMQGGDKGA